MNLRPQAIGSEERRTSFNRVAVVLPCLNEAAAIATVIAAFRLALPGAAIYVIDNGSTDGTGDRAAAAGVIAIIQPGGSVKDPEVVAACNEHGLPMVFTGRRHFKH